MTKIDNARVFVFLDANIALHFRRADEIDWLELAGSQSVTLVAAPVFVRELDRQKVAHSVKRLRDRAAATIAWLVNQMDSDDPICIRPGIEMLFLSSDPKTELEQHGLNRQIMDDWLIASVLEFDVPQGASVAVATADGGMALKLRTYGIRRIVPSDLARLPDVPDPLERENAELRKRLTAVERRSPRLTLEFDETEHMNIRNFEFGKNINHSPESLEAIISRLPFHELPHIEERSRNPVLLPGGRIDLSPVNLTEHEIGFYNRKLYNEQLSEYFREYEYFLIEWANWESEIQRTLQIELYVKNVGYAPASNIDIKLTLPDDVVPLSASALPQQPSPPEPPQFGTLSLAIGVSRPNAELVLNTRTGSRPQFRSHGNFAEVHLRSLKHHTTYRLERFLIQFADTASRRSISIGYHITANELPDPAEGTLHLIRESGRD